MIKCTVEMYGFALEESGISETELVLKDGATLRDLISALKTQIPALAGRVIQPDEDRLVERCCFNIEGRFYFHDDDMDLPVRDGWRVRLLTLATGG
jgi:molybdopterin converting factor small subunit